jgi:6-phosphogluconolactonase
MRYVQNTAARCRQVFRARRWRAVLVSSSLVLVLLASVMGPGGLASGQSTPSNLVAYWPFTGGTAQDVSGNHNDGVVVGATPTADRFGTPRHALSFDGVDDSIAIPNSISLLIGHSDYSIAAWIKTTNNTNNGRIFSKGSWNCTTGFMMRLNGNVAYLENAVDGNCLIGLDGTTNVTDGNWHLVVGVVDRHQGASLYVDCNLDGAESFDTSFHDLSNDRNPTIGMSDGANAGAPTEFFAGTIDDVRIYNKALNPAEARALYDINGGCPAPVLTQVPGSPFATGSGPRSAAFSPTGGFYGTANFWDNTVSVFTVGSNGALTPVPGSPFGTGASPTSIAFNPAGGLLATGNYGDGTVSLFSVGSNGSLTPVPGSPFAAGPNPEAVAFSPAGGLLAAANSTADTISVFSVGPNNSLTQIPGSPFPSGSSHPLSLAFSPTGSLLAAADYFGNAISVFSVSSNGSLTQVPGSPFATGTNPRSVRFSPGGGLLATANDAQSSVSAFSVATNGSLSQVAGSPFATGANPWSAAFSPDGRLLATANSGANTLSMFSVGSNGVLSHAPGSPFPTGNSPFAAAFSPSGKLLASTNVGDNTVSVFSVQ